VNSPCSQGAAGFGTNLAPSFTIGTGYFGRSSVGDNIGPEHLINWTRIAYNVEEPFGDFTGLEPWSQPALSGASAAAAATAALEPEAAAMRNEIRRIVLEELKQLLSE